MQSFTSLGTNKLILFLFWFLGKPAPLDMKMSIFTIWASAHSPNWNKLRGRTFIRLFTFSRLNDHRPSQNLNCPPHIFLWMINNMTTMIMINVMMVKLAFASFEISIVADIWDPLIISYRKSTQSILAFHGNTNHHK